MSEQESIYIKALQESAQIMFVTINGVFELHEAIDKDELVLCGYCSALANADIVYPCPTTAILLADMVVEDPIEPSEPAESE